MTAKLLAVMAGAMMMIAPAVAAENTIFALVMCSGKINGPTYCNILQQFIVNTLDECKQDQANATEQDRRNQADAVRLGHTVDWQITYYCAQKTAPAWEPAP